MVSSEVTSLNANIQTVVTVNKIKHYLKNHDQVPRKTPIPQKDFLDLVSLVLTAACFIFNS